MDLVNISAGAHNWLLHDFSQASQSRSATENLKSLLQVRNVKSQLLSTVAAAHFFASDSLKVLGCHVKDKFLREHGEGSVGRVQEKVVDNLLADYIDEAGSGKVVECVQDIMDVAAGGCEVVRPSQTLFHHLPGLSSYIVRAILENDPCGDRRLNLLAELLDMGKLGAMKLLVEGRAVRDALALELYLEEELGVVDGTAVPLLEVINDKVPQLIADGVIEAAGIEDTADEVVDDEDGVGDVGSSHGRPLLGLFLEVGGEHFAAKLWDVLVGMTGIAGLVETYSSELIAT